MTISENSWRQVSTLCILKVLGIVFGVSERAGESHMLDYGVIDSEWSQIDLHWKSGTNQKRDIYFHRCLSRVDFGEHYL